MKIPLSMVMGLLLSVPACNWNEPSRVAAAPEQQSTNADTQAQQLEVQNYVKSTQAKLAEYDKKIDGLEARVYTMGGTAKDDFKNVIEQLRDQKKGITSQLDNLKNAGPDSWRQLKPDVDLAMTKLERSYQDVAKKLDSTPLPPSKNPPNQQKPPNQENPPNQQNPPKSQ
jgi:TolA-binding protein